MPESGRRHGSATIATTTMNKTDYVIGNLNAMADDPDLLAVVDQIIILREGCTCFYSRSRGMFWRKGETSGNVQRVASIRPDCDGDALLVEMVKNEPACHRGTDSCFDGAEAEAEKKGDPRLTIDDLYRLLQDRNERRPEGSYTTYLFEKGLEKILKK